MNKSLNYTYVNNEVCKIQSIYRKHKNNKIIYYPSSSKEWFSNVYSYNKLYLKLLVVYGVNINKLFRSYSNMLQYKNKIPFKRRRHNKNRYSANKIYVSRPELKHKNTELFMTVFIYNKQKTSIERYIRKFVKIIKVLKVSAESIIEFIVKHQNTSISLAKNKTLVSKRVYEKDRANNLVLDDKGNPLLTYIVTHWDRVFPLLKNNFFVLKKFNVFFFRARYNLLNYLPLNIKIRKLNKMSRYNIILLKKLFKVQNLFFNGIKSINFNKSKFTNLMLNWRNLGLINLIQKIYNKKIEIKLVELKSIHLNSDVFSDAIALKLRDRQNKAVRVLRRAILQMVKIPDLHTLITYDDNIESMYENNNQSMNVNDYLISNVESERSKVEIEKSNLEMESLSNNIGSMPGNNIKSINVNYIFNTIKQQVVSGVRFEASGRLTRRLTAMRAVFKYRYVGSLKNIRSSFNNKSSTMLRGFVKSNSQYTIINSKTRNGSFGLKGWVSSH